MTMVMTPPEPDDARDRDDHHDAVDPVEAKTTLPQREEFNPFSVKRFVLIIGAIILGAVIVLFLTGFIAGMNGQRPATFDSEILRNQLQSLQNGEETIPNELERNE